MKKSIISLFLSVALIMAVFIPASAETVSGEISSESTTSSKENINIETVAENNDTDLLEEEPDPIEILLNGFESKCSDNYSGVYYEQDDSMYHIKAVNINNLVESINNDKIMKSAYADISEAIIFEQTDFSYAELNNIQKSLIEQFTKNKIDAQIYIDEKQSEIVVESSKAGEESFQQNSYQIAQSQIQYNSHSDTKSMPSRKSELKGIINFIENEVNIIQTASAIPFGSGIKIGTVDSYSYASGLSVLKDKYGVGTSDRDLGYLTCGHATVAEGQKVYYNGAEIGIVIKKKYQGDFDYAIIRSTNANYEPSTVAKDGVTKRNAEGMPITGYPVLVFGRNNNYSGSIVAQNVSWTRDGVAITNRMKYDVACILGDSGGAVIQITPSGQHQFIGVQTDANDDGSYSYGCWWTKIKSDCNADWNIGLPR